MSVDSSRHGRGPVAYVDDMLVGTVRSDGTVTMRIVRRTSQAMMHAQALSLVAERQARYEAFDIHLAIQTVQEAYMPLMSREERQRVMVQRELAPYAAEADELLTRVQNELPGLERAEEEALLERIYTCVVRVRRIEKICRERGVNDVADEAHALSERLTSALD